MVKAKRVALSFSLYLTRARGEKEKFLSTFRGKNKSRRRRAPLFDHLESCLWTRSRASPLESKTFERRHAERRVCGAIRKRDICCDDYFISRARAYATTRCDNSVLIPCVADTPKKKRGIPVRSIVRSVRERGETRKTGGTARKNLREPVASDKHPQEGREVKLADRMRAARKIKNDNHEGHQRGPEKGEGDAR